MSLWQLLASGGSAGALVLGGVVAALRRYRRSPVRELQPFTSFIAGNLSLWFRRRFSAAAARQFGVRRYVSLILDNFPKHLTVPAGGEDVRIEIDKSYVRLALSADSKRIPEESLVGSDPGTFLVFGEPGSGKSSLSKKLFRDACKLAYKAPHRARPPIHLELGHLDWRPGEPDQLEKKLGDAVAAMRGVHGGEFIVGSLSAGSGMIIILDGLDEVPAARLGDAQSAIHSLIKSFGGKSRANSVIVTARTQLRPALTRDFVDSFAKVCTLEPFSPPDVFTFLRRWPFADDRDWVAESNRIFADLREHPALAEMCSNPLVLSMYVAHDQRQASAGGRRPVRLPDTRPEFYKSVVNELLLFRREDQKGNRPNSGAARPAGTQLLKQRQRLLGEIALEHLLREDQPANSIAWDSAIEITCRVLKIKSRHTAETRLRGLAVETGIFTEERPGESLRFLHLTLCEYLAAHKLSESDVASQRAVIGSASGLTESRTPSRRLWEVIVFAVALVSDAIRRDALAQMENIACPEQLVLRAIREAQEFDSEVFRGTLTKTIDRLRGKPVESWDADWFAEVGLVVSCLADAHRLSEVQPMVELPTVGDVLKTLVGGDSLRFNKMLDTYLSISPAEALELIDRYDVGADVLGPRRLVKAMDQPDLVLLAVNRVLADSGNDEDWMLALAEAALTHELYAKLLVEEPPSSRLSALAARVSSQHRWDQVGPAVGSLYGCLLAIATAKVASIRNGFAVGLPRLGLVASVDPSRHPRDPYHIYRWATILYFLSLTMFSFMLVSILFWKNWAPDWPVAALFFYGIFLVWLISFALIRRCRLYYRWHQNMRLPGNRRVAEEYLLKLGSDSVDRLEADFAVLWDGNSAHVLGANDRHRMLDGLHVYTTHSGKNIVWLARSEDVTVDEDYENPKFFLLPGAFSPLEQAVIAQRFVGGMSYMESASPQVSVRNWADGMDWRPQSRLPIVQIPSENKARRRDGRRARESGHLSKAGNDSSGGSVPSASVPSGDTAG